MLSFAQAGTWAYAITGARTGDTAAANPGFLVQTMTPQYLTATPFAAMAGYGGPSSGPATLTWNVHNCWNSASAGVALKRVGD